MDFRQRIIYFINKILKVKQRKIILAQSHEVFIMSVADVVPSNKTIMRPEILGIIQNITEHHIEDDENTQVFMLSLVIIIVGFIVAYD